MDVDTGDLSLEELLPIDFEGVSPHTNARPLHANLGSKQKFTDWFENRTVECDLIKGQDFGVCFINLGSKECGAGSKGRGGHNAIDYWLTLDAAKEIAMLERNEAGKKIRRYFIEAEKRFRQQQQPAPELTMESLCRAFLDLQENSTKALEHVQQQVDVEEAVLSEAEQKSDGHLNNTAMCQTAGKRVNDYMRLTGTQELLKEAESVKGIPITGLVEILNSV